jgi:CheY-like chemotaxis protein
VNNPKKPAILIVEDDLSIRETMSELLTAEGYRVFAAPDGEVGLRLLEAIPRPCLVLLDLLMPVINGWDFMKFKNQDYKVATIPVVAMTATSKISNINGVERIIKKPVNLELFLRIIENYCGNSVASG